MAEPGPNIPSTEIGTLRVLLRRLRVIMSSPDGVEERLGKIVVHIAAIMVAEVSSIYLRRGDGTLELFATEGLNPQAVHTTLLKRGEGLVGLVAERAEPVKLAKAEIHPSFSYRPETGEDVYHSFLGVPILHSGHVLGVLTVQNHTHRHYSEEEEEVLQTTAMFVAELVASNEIEGLDDADLDLRRIHSHHLQGISVADGIAIGQVVLHEPRIHVEKLLAENIDAEQKRLDVAIYELRENVDGMLDRRDLAKTGEHRSVLETYRMFAHDKNWVLRMREAISTGLTAEAAVERVQNDIRARMDRQPDPFVRERLHDLDDLANRLQRILTNAQNSVMDELPEKAILFARSMGAAELLDYDRKKLCGIVLEEAGIASHIAIVAKALDIAAVGNVDNAVKLAKSGDDAVVDAKTGDVYIRPSMEVIDTYTDKLQMLHQKVEAYAKLRDLPATSLDNKNIGLLMNSGLAVDLPHLEETGADGIGLFRTELQFMVAKRFPRLDAQLATYKAALDAAGDKSVIFRTLDVGGDKILPYMRSEHREDNPELGWRAIRMGLDRPGLFRTQIRALLRAAEGRRISVMLPMVAEIAEIAEARRLIDTELKHLAKHGYITPGKIRMGVMLEVPSLLWQLDHLLPMVDFISVGSNDLAQFLFAADRVNSLVNSRFDPLLPAMLKVLRHIVDKTSEHNVPLTICGALAGKPLEAMVLLGLGFRSLSMAPSSIAPIKLMIRSLNITNLEDILLPLLAKSHRSLRDDMLKFARTQQVILE